MIPTFDLMFNSSSGKLESTFHCSKKKGRLLETYSHPASGKSKSMEAKAQAVFNEGGRGSYFLVWLVPTRETQHVLRTHRGTSKDSHDPQSASVCARDWTQAEGCGAKSQTRSLSPHSRLCPIQPSVCKMSWKAPSDQGDQSWETSLCRRRHHALMSATRAANERHTMHFRALRVDLKSRDSEIHS